MPSSVFVRTFQLALPDLTITENIRKDLDEGQAAGLGVNIQNERTSINLKQQHYQRCEEDVLV